MCQIMMRTVQPSPESKQTTSLQVAVRCRPLTAKEKLKSRDILRVVDDKVVVVLDPDLSKEYLDRVQNRSKEKKYAFDIAFGAESTNLDVYNVTVSSIVEGVLRGLNATIFAYGATGSGKTHTMAGTAEDPGLMVLSLQSIFSLITKQEADYEFVVTCSYLEVYNEVIYDLLERSSGHLELREDPDQGITVAGLKRIQVNTAEKILELLTQGNARRKTESTDANATSSRSHAVLEIIVKRRQRNQYRPQMLRAKLALVDLAGSERASETNNVGQKLRDGANINRSLLALANCINALGKQQKKGLAYVPYRNSKLTRLLKDGLSGNSRTVMVATISSGADQYHHTTNTLKYADRAKEIKTHIQAVPEDDLPRQPVRTSGPSIIARRVRERGGDNYDASRGASYIEVKGANTNGGTVDAHVADYQRLIDNLQVEVTNLRRELADKETLLSARTPEKEKSADDELSWLDMLSHDINDNVEERINLQKALFELEDMNLHNRAELQRLDELIAESSLRRNGEKDDALVERRQVVLDNIRDNDEAGAHYRQDIETNEAQRKELQRHIDEAIDSDRNKTFLRILTQYRLLGMTNMELQFQMAIRDQIIHDQREALSNLWLVLECSGLKHEQIAEIAAQQGIMIEEGIMPVVAGRTHVPSTPIPILHKQPSQATASGNKQLAPGQQQSDDAVVTSEYEDCGNQPWRELDDSAPGTPHDENNSLGYGDHPRAESSTSPSVNYESPADLREDGEGSVQIIENNLGNKKLRGPRSVQSVESAGSASVNTIGLEQSSSKNGGDGPSTSSPTLMVPRTSTYARSRRRPRSAERWQQHMHERYETTTGTDAASEGSEAGADNDSSHDKQSRAHFDRAQSADNQLLRKELSRLDKELQDLKRGIERHTTSSESHALIKDATDPKEVSRQRVRTTSTSPLPSTNRFQSNESPSPLSAQLKCTPTHANGSQVQQSLAGTFAAPALNGPSWEPDSPEIGLPPQETGVSKVSPPSGSNFSNGHSDVNSRRSTLKDRRKPKFDLPTSGTRQSWPRNGTDWK